jgi:hypothetical protein
MSVDEGTIENNNLGHSLEPTLQQEPEIGMEVDTTTPIERRGSGQRENEQEDMVEPAEGDQELKTIPENEEEEEKEHIFLATTNEAKISSSKKPSKSSQQQHKTKRKEEKTILLSSLSKPLDKQGAQIAKIMQILEPVQKQIQSAQNQLKLIKQLQSQLKRLQKQVSQIQKDIIRNSKRK